MSKNIIDPPAAKRPNLFKKNLHFKIVVAVLIVGIIALATKSHNKASQRTIQAEATDKTELAKRSDDSFIDRAFEKASYDEEKKNRIKQEPSADATSKNGAPPDIPLPVTGPNEGTYTPPHRAAAVRAEHDALVANTQMIQINDDRRDKAVPADNFRLPGELESTAVPDQSKMLSEIAEQTKKLQKSATDGSAPAGSDRQARQWLEEYADSNKVTPAIRATLPLREYFVPQGFAIPVVASRAINSDLPGPISAVVTMDVYDHTGKKILIPRGTTIHGSHNSDTAAGQDRILSAVTRMILPDGRSLELPAFQGLDAAGAVGLPADVNNHYLQRFGTGFFLGWIANRTQQPSNVSILGGGSANTSGAGGQVIISMAQSEIARNQNIKPTLTIAPGEKFNIDVASDLILQPWEWRNSSAK